MKIEKYVSLFLELQNNKEEKAMLIQIGIVSILTDKPHVFLLQPCTIMSKEQLKLDPKEFYKGSIQEFPHYETRILAPLFLPDQLGSLNYHFSNIDHKPYVFYPARINNLSVLETILKVWAVGQVIILEFNRSLNDLLVESAGNENFLTWARENHGVEVTSYYVNRR